MKAYFNILDIFILNDHDQEDINDEEDELLLTYQGHEEDLRDDEDFEIQVPIEIIDIEK